MIRTMLRRAAGRTLLMPALLLAAGLVAGCGALDVSDPTRVEDEDLANAAGADLLRVDALKRLYAAVGHGTHWSGVLSDELITDSDALFGGLSFTEVLDRRRSEEFEALYPSLFDNAYTKWVKARVAATAAMPKLRAYALAPAHLGEMFAVRGFAALRLAEDFCPGFPLNEMVEYQPVYGPPLTTAEAFARAVADFDSALVYAADSARVLNLVRVGRGRALLGLGQFAEAAVAVQGVPVDYVWNAEFTMTNSELQNPVWWFDSSENLVLGVGDQEGGTGLDFVTAADPRLETDSLGLARDGATVLYGATKYPDPGASIVIASGIEARLIEAEAAFHDDGDWLGILNSLRATQVTPALPALTDPGTPAARVDLLFRERAFWLWGTGHRLGDLRRLIAHYGRSSETVFPTGSYRLGGVYETATSIPFPAAFEAPHNPAVTGCTSR